VKLIAVVTAVLAVVLAALPALLGGATLAAKSDGIDGQAGRERER
jgi:hypothetical protein